MTDDDILTKAKAVAVKLDNGELHWQEYKSVVPELIAEIEANQIMLRQFQVHEDQTHAAMEKIVGNSDNFVELTRQMKAEVERLQRLMDVVENTSRLRSNRLEEQIEALVIQKSAKTARIKELEAILAEAENFRKNSVKHFDLIANQRDEALVEIERLKGGTQIDNKSGVGIRCKCGELVLIDTTEQDQYLKRLEAAFLDSLAARLYYEHYPGVSDAYSWHDYPEDACHCMPKEKFREKAREALERIKNGND